MDCPVLLCYYLQTLFLNFYTPSHLRLDLYFVVFTDETFDAVHGGIVVWNMLEGCHL